jgi:hypothetical protein
MLRVAPFVMEGFARRTSCVPFLHELGSVGGVGHGLPAGAGQLVQRAARVLPPALIYKLDAPILQS